MSSLRRDDGALSIEFVGMLPIVAFAALVVWQLLLAGLVATTAENAARAGSREGCETAPTRPSPAPPPSR
jgi:hypothetical protein